MQPISGTNTERQVARSRPHTTSKTNIENDKDIKRVKEKG